jgi:hypothetical protein
MVRLGMAAAVLALMASPLLAQDSTESLKKELEQLRAEVDGLKAVNATKEIPSSGKIAADAMAADDNPVMTLFKGTKLSGYVDVGYQFSFNHLGNVGTATNNVGTNPVRLFDDRDNSFYVNSVLLQLERLANKDMIVGYHIELDAGHNPGIYDNGRLVSLQEGWVQILAPLGSGLDIRVGRMATLAGYEVLESVNNMNYSRGMLFGIVQPFTHTGVRLSYWITEQIGATLGFSNGLNLGTDYADDDHGKMLELQVATKFMKDLTANITFLYSNETANLSEDAGDGTFLFDLVVAYTMDKLTLALNIDIASSQDTIGSRRAPFSGFALYAKYQITDSISQALRFEYMSDGNGAILGTAIPGNSAADNDSGTGSRVFGVTLTTEMKVASQLILRWELRFDNSNNHDFTRDHDRTNTLRPARGDVTMGFEAIMPF